MIEIPYVKGRIAGSFELHAQPGDRVRARFTGTFCGKPHHGSIHFVDRGANEAQGYRNLYAGQLDTPTWAAQEALVEALVKAAQQVVRTRAPVNTETFAAVERDYARSEYEMRKAEVVKLREQIAAAERAVEAARLHFIALGGSL